MSSHLQLPERTQASEMSAGRRYLGLLCWNKAHDPASTLRCNAITRHRFPVLIARADSAVMGEHALTLPSPLPLS